MPVEHSPQAIRQAAAGLLHWREQNGGAVRWRHDRRAKAATTAARLTEATGITGTMATFLLNDDCHEPQRERA